MAGTIVLTDGEAVRDWASRRVGFPAIVDVSPSAGTQPMLRIVFDQAAYQDQDRPERPVNSGGYDLVEWDEWLKLFEDGGLALEVMEEQQGVKDSWHRIISRDEAPYPPGLPQPETGVES